VNQLLHFLTDLVFVVCLILAWGYVVQQWLRDRDLLVQESTALAQRVAPARPVRVEAPPAERRKSDKLAQPKDSLFEREEIRQRMADFNATQDRFQQEREEFFKKTMAKLQTHFVRREA
jgi:hypothetical protein